MSADDGSSDAVIAAIPAGQLGANHLGCQVRVTGGTGYLHGRLDAIYAPKPHLRTLTIGGSVTRDIPAGILVHVIQKETS